MQKQLLTLLVICSLGLLWLPPAAQADGPYPLVEAFFAFDTLPQPDEFVFKLTDLEKIREARAILREENGYKNQVTGIIIPDPIYYNAPWSFHLDPDTIEFFEVATEVCDAAITYVEEHLGEVGGAFLPGNRWCPWTSRLVREIRMR